MPRLEQQIQRAIVQHLNLRARSDVWFTHVPANRRNRIEGAIVKSMGLRKGCPDLLLACDGRLFALELKTERGRPTPDQKTCQADLLRAGARATTAYGIDEALRILESWQLLKGTS